MLPKQREMDSIVQMIYTALENNAHLRSTLLVLCGDHGMNEAGNHGGSSSGETSTALVFLSPTFTGNSTGAPCPTDPGDDFQFYQIIEQSDIVPTLAGLLGFPVPRNNLGVFIPRILDLWKDGQSASKALGMNLHRHLLRLQIDSEKIELLLQNAQQILKIIDANGPGPSLEQRFDPLKCPDSSSDLHELACDWKQVSQLLHTRTGSGFRGTEELLSALFKVCTGLSRTLHTLIFGGSFHVEHRGL